MIQHIVRYSKIKYIIIHYIVKYSKVLLTINYNTSVLLSRAEYILYTLLHYNEDLVTLDLFCRFSVLQPSRIQLYKFNI